MVRKHRVIHIKWYLTPRDPPNHIFFIGEDVAKDHYLPKFVPKGAQKVWTHLYWQAFHWYKDWYYSS